MACDEKVSPGQHYHRLDSLFDGTWDHWKHCLRCWAMLRAIEEKMREQGEYSVALDPCLDCGESWADNFGDPPSDVAALAFALPGEISCSRLVAT